MALDQADVATSLEIHVAFVADTARDALRGPGGCAHGAHGVPTIVLESGYAVYGPVVVPAPTGDDAVVLWDLVRSMPRFPNLYELRHPKTHDDLVHVADSFEPILTTRDWNTVENPAP